MQSSQHPRVTVWQRLKEQEISCEKAIELLVDKNGIVNLDLLAPEVTNRFLRSFPDRKLLPAVMPLLLWRNCYYLGSSAPLPREIIPILSQQTLTEIKVIAIADRSYQDWVRACNLNPHRLSVAPPVNPLTKELVKTDFQTEDIAGDTELALSKADDQIGRIKTIISSALRSRASDIHL